MINSSNTSPMVSQSLPKWVAITFAVAALIGFSDASYLTAEHLRGVTPPCSVVHGCEVVLTSSYATVLGVPLSVLGMVYYATLLVLLVAYADSGNKQFFRWACRIAVGGFLFTLWLVYLQAFVLHAFCQYCMLSALVSLVLLGLSVYSLRNP